MPPGGFVIMLFIGGGPFLVSTSGGVVGGGPSEELLEPHPTAELAIATHRRLLIALLLRLHCQVFRLVITFIVQKVPYKFSECVLK